MENLEEAARLAAERWKDRDSAKDDLRTIVLELQKTMNMTQIAAMVGIQRTTLYYFMYGRDGKTKPSLRAHGPGIRIHDEQLNYRKSA